MRAVRTFTHQPEAEQGRETHGVQGGAATLEGTVPLLALQLIVRCHDECGRGWEGRHVLEHSADGHTGACTINQPLITMHD